MASQSRNLMNLSTYGVTTVLPGGAGREEGGFGWRGLNRRASTAGTDSAHWCRNFSPGSVDILWNAPQVPASGMSIPVFICAHMTLRKSAPINVLAESGNMTIWSVAWCNHVTCNMHYVMTRLVLLTPFSTSKKVNDSIK